MDQFIMQLLALDNSIVVTVLFYSICFLVGLFFYSGIKDFNDFAIGGQPFYFFSLGATTVATIVGAQYTFGFSEQLYNIGFVVAIMFFGEIIQKYLIAYIVSPKVNRLKNLYTMGELFHKLYGKNGQIFAGVLAGLSCCICVALQINVFGYMAQAFFGIDANLGAVFSAIIVTTYCFFGGIRAVVATDVVQIVIFIVVLPIISYIALDNFGGLALLIEQVSTTKMVEISHHPDLSTYLLLFLIFALPHFDPAEFHRLIIARTGYRVKKSMKLAGFVSTLVFLVIMMLTAMAYVSNDSLAGNEALLYTFSTFLPSDIAIAGYLSLIAVVMSTIDSYLNTASVIIVNDVIEPVFGRFQQSLKKVKAARRATVMIGFLACYFALNSESVMALVYNVIDLWYPTMVVPIYACMFNIKTSFKVVVKAMAVGLAVFFTWQYFDLESTTLVMPVIPSMLANVAAFALFRYAERRQPLAHLEANMSELQYGVKDIDNKCNLIGTNLLDGEIEFNENDIYKLQQLEAQATQVKASLDNTIKRAQRFHEVERLKNIELETKDHLVRAKSKVSEEA